MSELELDNSVLTADRRAAGRRVLQDRRAAGGNGTVAHTGEERRVSQRRKVERRRQIDPTCERDYTTDEIEFMRAMDEYRRKSGRQFPTWSEVLEVLKALGYKRD